MSDRIVYLKPPERKPDSDVVASPSIVVGRRYRLDKVGTQEDMHGICGGLDYSIPRGRVVALASSSVPGQAYIWDLDEELMEGKLNITTIDGKNIPFTSTANIITSHFVLSHSTLSEPQIIDQDSTPKLTTTACFQFVFSTRFPAVRLGILSLVESQCFVQLKNGERQTLRDNSNGQAMLYLPDAIRKDEVFSPILNTGAENKSIQGKHDIRLAWSIPQQLNGSEIDTMTVQEQYTSFFMQRELPVEQDNIWTPVCAPISWGWSMRIAKRHDGDWCIVRQKVLSPTLGHNGLVMPEWEGNLPGY